MDTSVLDEGFDEVRDRICKLKDGLRAIDNSELNSTQREWFNEKLFYRKGFFAGVLSILNIIQYYPTMGNVEDVLDGCLILFPTDYLENFWKYSNNNFKELIEYFQKDFELDT